MISVFYIGRHAVLLWGLETMPSPVPRSILLYGHYNTYLFGYRFSGGDVFELHRIRLQHHQRRVYEQQTPVSRRADGKVREGRESHGACVEVDLRRVQHAIPGGHVPLASRFQYDLPVSKACMRNGPNEDQLYHVPSLTPPP